jgi:hypothetical protein
MNKTTPETVAEANWGLFEAKMNLPEAAAHCGMTQKEMKMTFREFLKYHPATYASQETVQADPSASIEHLMIGETHGGF